MPYIYIAYSREPPYLPIAVGDTAQELAKQIGKSRGCVASMIRKYELGEVKKSIYMRVFVEDETCWN